jgi:hypothetical protein
MNTTQDLSQFTAHERSITFYNLDDIQERTTVMNKHLDLYLYSHAEPASVDAFALLP